MADETEAAAEGSEHGAQVAGSNGAEGDERLGEIVLEQAEAGMPQLDPSIYPNLIFWLIIAILAIYFILTRVALPRIGAVLAERSDAITGDLEQAALLRQRAEEAEQAYNAALAKAREEAQKIAADAKAEVNKELSVLLAKADAEIAARSAESEGRIAEIRDSAVRSVEEVARETTGDIVGAILPGTTADEPAVEAAVATRMKG